MPSTNRVIWIRSYFEGGNIVSYSFAETDRRFTGAYCPNHQGDHHRSLTNRRLVNFYVTIRCSIPEDCHFHIRSRENLKAYKIICSSVSTAWVRDDVQLLYLVTDSVQNSKFSKATTERRGWVVNTPASYSGGQTFTFRPGDRLSWLRFSWFLSARTVKCLDSASKLCHYRFLLSPFQSVFHL
jgi:hypothetical protein